MAGVMAGTDDLVQLADSLLLALVARGATVFVIALPKKSIKSIYQKMRSVCEGEQRAFTIHGHGESLHSMQAREDPGPV